MQDVESLGAVLTIGTGRAMRRFQPTATARNGKDKYYNKDKDEEEGEEGKRYYASWGCSKP